jgi:hypothetical protein
VADDYNPFEAVPTPEIPNQTRIVFHTGFQARMRPTGEFNKLGWQPHKAPEGFSGGDYSLSALHYGEPAANQGEEDSLAEWYFDAKEHAIVLRLSWTKLLVTDPSSTQALFAYSQEAGIRTATMNGIEISVFTLKQGAPGTGMAGASMVSSIPADVGSRVNAPPLFLLKRWTKVNMDPYRKKAYFAVQQMFAAPGEAQPAAQPRSRASAAGSSGALGQ